MKMYFLLKMGIFQPAMLVYQRVCFCIESKFTPISHSEKKNIFPKYSLSMNTSLMKLKKPPDVWRSAVCERNQFLAPSDSLKDAPRAFFQSPMCSFAPAPVPPTKGIKNKSPNHEILSYLSMSRCFSVGFVFHMASDLSKLKSIRIMLQIITSSRCLR